MSKPWSMMTELERREEMARRLHGTRPRGAPKGWTYRVPTDHPGLMSLRAAGIARGRQMSEARELRKMVAEVVATDSDIEESARAAGVTVRKAREYLRR